MSELTTEQIVKIVIGVLVLVVVLSGAWLLFREHLFPYFAGFAPVHNLDASSAFGKEVVQEKNLVATFPLINTKNFLIFSGESVKSALYFPKSSDVLRRDVRAFSSFSWRGVFGVDQDVGSVDGSGKLVIQEAFLSDTMLQKIQEAYRFQGGLYKIP